VDRRVDGPDPLDEAKREVGLSQEQGDPDASQDRGGLPDGPPSELDHEEDGQAAEDEGDIPVQRVAPTGVADQRRHEEQRE
jgi:hypothetical protein